MKGTAPATSSQKPPSPFASKFLVNTTLLPIKIHYFFYFGAFGAVYPFIPLMASRLGFSSAVIGIIYGIMPWCAVVAKPCFGAIADRYGAHKISLLAFLVFLALFFFALQWTTPLPTSSSVTLFCNSTLHPHVESCVARDVHFVSSVKKIEREVICDVECYNKTIKTISFDTDIVTAWNLCYSIPLKSAIGFSCDQSNVTCNLESCSNTLVKNLATQPKLEIEDAVNYGSFWLLLFLITMIKICLSVDISVADTICFYMLKDKPYNFGYQRLWGSLSWGIASTIAALLVDAYSDESRKNFTPLFYVSLFLFTCALVNGFFLKWHPEEKSKDIVKSLWKKILNVHVMLFLFANLIFGAFTQIMWVYIFVYIEEVATTSTDFVYTYWLTTLKGLLLMIQSFAEVPFLFVSEMIITKIGPQLIYTAILAAWSIRFFFYYRLTNPWLALPIEVLNGITFGLFYATMTTYANSVAPLGAEATVQGVTSAIFEGVGLGIGGFLGGGLIRAWGHRTMFLTMSIVAFVACLGHGACHFAIVWWVNKKAEKKLETPLTDK